MPDIHFQSDWLDMTTPPIKGERCLVTDGEFVVIGTYLTENDGSSIWIFADFSEENAKTFKVKAWMPLPKPKKTNEKIVGSS